MKNTQSINALSMLTIRKLPPISDGNGAHKQRLDSTLGRMVQEQVALRFPKLRVSKRFAIELALQEWMSDRGMLRQAPCTDLEKQLMHMEMESAQRPTPMRGE